MKVSLKTRFEQYKEYAKNIGFLFPKNRRILMRKNLSCVVMELKVALKYGERSDIDAINFIWS